MPTAELDFKRPHLNQKTILDDPARFRVAVCGRRFGKTEVGKQAIVLEALPGKRCWWTAPTYQMASAVWRELKLAVRPLPGLVLNQSERYMEFPGGGYIAVRSTHDHHNLRGEGLDFAVLDEAAFMHPDVWPAIIRPMLLEKQGGALFLSTPFGRNHFWRLYGMALDPLENEWAAFHFTSYDNPLIRGDEIDNIRRNTPERIFLEEYLAEFTDDAGQVFRRVKENATVVPGGKPQPGHRYVFGVDWARDNDYTVVAVLDSTTREIVALDRFNQISWAVQRGRLRALHDQWKPATIWAEENSIGSPNIEALQAEGLPVHPFQTTAQSKSPLIESLALALERDEIKLLKDDVVINEFISYRLNRLPGGGYRYEAPPGQHDDTVIAIALCWRGVRSEVGSIRVLNRTGQ